MRPRALADFFDSEGLDEGSHIGGKSKEIADLAVDENESFFKFLVFVR